MINAQRLHDAFAASFGILQNVSSCQTGDNPKHHRVIGIATNTSTVLSAPMTYAIVTAGVELPNVVYRHTQDVASSNKWGGFIEYLLTDGGK